MLFMLRHSAKLWPFMSTVMKKPEASHHKWQQCISGEGANQRQSEGERDGPVRKHASVRSRRLRRLDHIAVRVTLGCQSTAHKYTMAGGRISQQRPGIPLQTWTSTAMSDLRKTERSWKDVAAAAKDRKKRRQLVARCIVD